MRSVPQLLREADSDADSVHQSDANRNRHSNRNSYGDRHRDGDANRNPNADCNDQSYCHGHRDGDANRNPNADRHSDQHPNPDAYAHRYANACTECMLAVQFSIGTRPGLQCHCLPSTGKLGRRFVQC
jgi:hypothetical protein